VNLQVHIPDGFLSTPVWAALDAAAAPAAAVVIRRAQRTFDPARVPALGVMGAFVFAAQMVNFPVGAGTSSHLVGGALLAFTLGPAAASVVMIAILAIQSLIFQDGGLLALGANVLNMAVVGVLAGYLPFYLWGAGPRRKLAVFAGGALSVLVSAVLALSELIVSGVPMPRVALALSMGVFAVSALLEGAITLAVVQGLDAMQPDLVRNPAPGRPAALGAVGLAAVLLGAVGALFASTAPDGIERLTRFDAAAAAPWLNKAAAGLGGLALVYGACFCIGRLVAKRGSA
jgi:cobalt/nickel transport system permease protein